MAALITDVKRNALDDGPGIRSTVFFKGCVLRCVWCQNPETLSPRRQLQRRGALCIGCQLCHVACHDGAHQCIHLPGTEKTPGHVAPRAEAAARKAREAPGDAPYRVPWVDETECVGCNLCALVCPVDGCIEMVERRRGPDVETWNDRVRKGTDHIPGGLADL